MTSKLDISFHVHNDLWKARLKPYQKTIRNILETAASEVVMPNANFSQEHSDWPGKFSDVASSSKKNVDTSLRWYDKNPVFEIAVVLADDAFIKDLNSQYRGKNKATNVLSFPDEDFSITNNLGDIVLAFETIEKEAREQEKTFRDHAGHLLVHGFLHLLGHDHMEEKEALIMENKEIKILKKLDINNPYL